MCPDEPGAARPPHIACEPPAAFEDEARARGLDLVRVELDGGEEAPDWREFDGLIVMGGPMGAYEDEAHSWLTAEKWAIAEAARSGHPVGVSAWERSCSPRRSARASIRAVADGELARHHNQASAYRNAYALQFHLEVPPALALRPLARACGRCASARRRVENLLWKRAPGTPLNR